MTMKEQLKLEINQVERILELAKDSSTLDQADDLAMEFMKTQQTNSISSIELTEYIAYHYDVQRHKENGDLAAAKASQQNLDDSLQELEQELDEARALCDRFQ
jgi:hypothetical protein